MADRLRFHPLVATDLREAIEWYDERSIGLGDRFRSAVDERFDDIDAAPIGFARAFEDSDLQFARVKHFPYLVLFRYSKNVIWIAGVFHTASDPEKWKRRLPP